MLPPKTQIKMYLDQRGSAVDCPCCEKINYDIFCVSLKTDISLKSDWFRVFISGLIQFTRIYKNFHVLWQYLGEMKNHVLGVLPRVLSLAITLQGTPPGDLLPPDLSWLGFWPDSIVLLVSSTAAVSFLAFILSSSEEGLLMIAKTFLVLGGVRAVLGTCARISAGRCSGEGDRSMDHLNDIESVLVIR